MERREPEDHKSISSPVLGTKLSCNSERVGGHGGWCLLRILSKANIPAWRLSFVQQVSLWWCAKFVSVFGGGSFFLDSCEILISSVERREEFFYGKVIALGMVMADFVCIVTCFNSKY